MKLIYKNLILSFAIILISSLGAFAQKDDDKKPKEDDRPKIKINPKPDEKPRPTPKPDDPKKPNSVLIDTRRSGFENGVFKIFIG